MRVNILVGAFKKGERKGGAVSGFTVQVRHLSLAQSSPGFSLQSRLGARIGIELGKEMKLDDKLIFHAFMIVRHHKSIAFS